jgi:two-component system cell cycle sensor histidine kinase PleC
MRSAETSGVEAKGFGWSELGLAIRATATRARHLTLRLSSTTVAIGTTALVAATLSIAVDFVRTMDETQQAERQIMGVAVAEPVAFWNYNGSAMRTLANAGDTAATMSGVMQRGAGAFALAFAVIGLAMVRRRSTPRNPVADPHEALLATLPFGAACWTAEGRLIACNEQYQACLHLDQPLRPGASYSASIKQLVHGGYTQFLSDTETSRLLELHRQDGSCLMIDERPLAGGGFVTLVTDVTESRRTDDLLNTIREEQRQLARRYHEEKLKAEAASRSKTSFLAHLSHDIRTPLNAIIGFAEMMRQQTYGPLGDKRYASYVEDMKTSGERLLSFFGRVLELVELEKGEKPLKAEAFYMDDMLTAVARRFAAQAQRAGIAFNVVAQSGARLIGDRFALERMTGNILENALRHTPGGGKVNLAVYSAADGVVIEISDTGSGMSQERLEALSQPFAFGDSALTRQHSGAGLGIAIARAIAELSGGRLAIDSRPALGTTVAISLPLPAANPTARAA